MPANATIEQLSTVHLDGQVERRALTGGVLSALSQGCQFVLQLAYNIVLARLLGPREFGLYGMVMAIAAFMNMFKDAGLSTVTIQKESITQAQVSNLFWINLGVGGFATLLMVCAAPAIGWFYRQPEVTPIAVACAACFLLEGLATQHIAVLNRQMRFAAVSAVEIAATAGGLAVGMILAIAGAGYWSLVAALLSTSAIRVAAAWTLSPWRPSLPTTRTGTRPLVHFGVDLTLSGVLFSIARGTDLVLIGRSLGTEAVGLYSRASALLERPMERLLAPIYQVIVPALSRLQDAPDRYRKTYLQIFGAVAIAGFFLAGVSVPLARPLVTVVLGRRWEAAAPIFAAMGLAALFVPLSAATSWLYLSQGRGRALLRTSVITALTMTSAFALGIYWGTTGVALAYALWGVCVDLPVTFYIGGSKGPVTTADLWAAATRRTPVFAATFAATWLVASLPILSVPLLRVLAAGIVGLLTAATVVWASPSQRRSIVQFVRMVRTMSQAPAK